MTEHRKLIKASGTWTKVNFEEIWRYRDLLYFLTVRGIKAKYAQSVLGILWALIQPLLTAAVFAIVFGRLARVETGGVPYLLFFYLALWPWSYFSGSLAESSLSLVNNSSIITKVYFPRLVIPLSATMGKLLDFAIAFTITLAFLAYYRVVPNWNVIWLPALVIELICSSLGISLILSAMAVQYRDIKHAMTFVLQLIMYAAPVVYSTHAVPEQFQFLYSLNPMVGIIEGFRAAFLGDRMPWHWIWPGSITCVLVLAAGLIYFQRKERVFADVV